MSTLSFSAIIDIREGNPYILVSRERIKTFKPGWKKPLPVRIQVNNKPTEPWRINMMPAGNGDFYLYLHGDVRRSSDTKVGDRVNVHIVFDTEYQNGPMHPVPPWFSDALSAHPVALKNWEQLIPSRKKEILRYFSWLKSEEAIQRNLRRALHVLEGNDGRFMARSWSNGM